MPTRLHHRRFEVPAPSGVVAAVLRDPSTIPRIHPLITAVTETGRREDDGVEIVAFEVQERLPLGPFSLPTRYPAQLRAAEEQRIELTARAEPGVTIRTVFLLEERGKKTGIEERVEVTAPWWLIHYVANTVERAHNEQAQALTALFPGSGGA